MTLYHFSPRENGNAASCIAAFRFCFTPRTSHSRNSRDADEDGECDILLDHGLRGGGLILLNLLRETGKSGEDEQLRGDSFACPP